MPLLTLIALPFIGSVIAALLPTNARNAASGWAGLIALIAFAQALLLIPDMLDGSVLREQWQWLPSAGLDFVVRVDGFAWMFALLVLGIGLLVVLYARYYMSPRRSGAALLFLLPGVHGRDARRGAVGQPDPARVLLGADQPVLVPADRLLASPRAMRAAARAWRSIVTGAGGLCLLAGVLLLGHIVGSYDLDAVLAAGDAMPCAPAVSADARAGAARRVHQERAVSVPLLAAARDGRAHAGLGLSALGDDGQGGRVPAGATVAGAGRHRGVVLDRRRRRLGTLLLGAYVAMFQNDLKGLLAYSTISHLGLITLLLGLNSPLAAVAAVFHMMNHATFKASLFMAAGIIDHETGTRDMRRLHGLFKAMPITGTLAMVASAAMAGVPLLNGFLSKEMFFAETVYISSLPVGRVRAAAGRHLAGMFAVVYALRFGYGMFFGPPSTDLPRDAARAGALDARADRAAGARLPGGGRRPGASIGRALAAAARPVVGGPLPEYSLAVWHGFNAPLVMSLIAMAGGHRRLPVCCASRPVQGRLRCAPPLSPPGRQARCSSARSRLLTALAARACARSRHAAPAAADCS